MLGRKNNGHGRTGGKKIVLTASAIEMSDFNLNAFIAFTGGFPSKIVPRDMLRKYWYPPTPFNPDGTAKFAPYGLRKVESLLIEEFGEENVVTVYPTMLEHFVGENTRVVGITSMDPLGIGFVSRTYTGLVAVSGKSMSAAEFEDLLANPVFSKYRVKKILGGSGAWQVHKAGLQEKMGLDTIVMGEAEAEVVALFRKAVNGEPLPKLVTCKKPEPETIPLIKKPALYGFVEIMRGCGRGCAFCSPTMRQRHSFPLEHIMKEVQLNARNGTKMISLQTDDVFLYHAKPGFLPNREAIVKLIKLVHDTPGVELIQIAHASLAPVVYDPKMMEEICPLLVEKSRWRDVNNTPYCTVEVGIETGSERLMEKYMRGKMLPYKPEQWQEVVVQAIKIMNDNRMYPLGTLITGLPDEKPEDTIKTLELLDKLKDMKIFYVPLLFTSEEDCILHREKHADLSDLNELQWEFIARCWEHNVKCWVEPNKKPFMLLGSIFAYFLYYRWVHGKKALKPILKFSGWENYLMRKPATQCNPMHCQGMGPDNTKKM
ncbi:MAG: B12-binding domain-containing radical SAM protein [Thermoplasmata archaeon]|nr:B12-binding domain-containing radical SAM protein [Thermoplasmata archaeon]